MDVPTTPASHATHDELLLAAFASGDDLAPADAARATALEVDCPSCAALVADIRDLMAATAALPAPARRRDFRLTDADAARLRPAGWRGLVAAFGDARLAFTRPLAAGLVTVGIAGLLLAITPGILAPTGGATSFMAAEAPFSATGPAEMPVPDAIDGAASPAPELGGLPAGAGAPAVSPDADVPAVSPGASGVPDLALPPDGDASVQGGDLEATSADRATVDGSPAPKSGDAALAAGSEAGAPEARSLDASTEAPAGGSSDLVPWVAVMAAALVGLGALLFALRAAGRRILES
jgi:hypothetical protein